MPLSPGSARSRPRRPPIATPRPEWRRSTARSEFGREPLVGGDRNPDPLVGLLGPRDAAASALRVATTMTVTRRGRFAIRGVERSRLWAGPAAGKREPQDRSLHHPQLLGERTGVVGEAVALADVLHARRDLAIAAARHVGKEVML